MKKDVGGFDMMLGAGSGGGVKRQRASVGELATRGNETFLSGRRKYITLGAGLVLWSFLGYNKDVIPSPTDTVAGVLDAAGWAITIPDRAFSDESSASTVPTAPTETAPQTTNQQAPVSTPSSAGNPTNLVPVISNAPDTVTTLPVTTGTVTDAEPLPPIVQYSAAAGSVVCDGLLVNITINPDSGVPPLTQITEQTGEPWNQGQPNSTIDAALYEEAAQGRLQFPVRTSCDGLEQ